MTKDYSKDCYKYETKVDGGYFYKHRQSSTTATLVIYDPKENKILIVKRGSDSDAEPNKWSLPGGYREVGKENVRDAAKREMKEELNLDIDFSKLKLLDVWDEPETDLRAHVTNVCFTYTLSPEEKSQIKFDPEELNAMLFTDAINALSMVDAFNHNDILTRGLKQLLS